MNEVTSLNMKEKMTFLPKEKKRFSFLLINIAFWHVVASMMAIHVGVLRYPYPELSPKKINYWFWILTWWSYLTSFLTIIWAFYKLFNRKNNYFSQMADLVITNTNVVDTVFIFGLIVYYLGGGKFQLITAPPQEEKWIEVYWIIYNFIWHVVAPGLVIYYFFKFSQTDLLEKKYKLSILGSLIFPTSYFFYVMFRPFADQYYREEAKIKIAGFLNSSSSSTHFTSEKLQKLKNIYQNPPQSYQMPKDYPYPFFFRCAGKKTNPHDKVSKRRIIWIIGTFLVWYLVFSSLSCLLLKGKKWLFSQEKKENSEPILR